jgi:hypothetical protein
VAAKHFLQFSMHKTFGSHQAFFSISNFLYTSSSLGIFKKNLTWEMPSSHQAFSLTLDPKKPVTTAKHFLRLPI